MEKDLNKFSTTKTTVELYKIRHPSGLYWADITIDNHGSRGRIQVASDYGNYSNYWGACGEGFKKFLTGIGIHYAADKFGADRWFDFEKTIKEFKRRIIETKEYRGISKDEAKILLNQVKYIQENCSQNEHEFAHIIWEQRELMRFFDGSPDLCYSISPQFQHFWDSVWQVFIAQLKTELATEMPAEA